MSFVVEICVKDLAARILFEGLGRSYQFDIMKRATTAVDCQSNLRALHNGFEPCSQHLWRGNRQAVHRNDTLALTQTRLLRRGLVSHAADRHATLRMRRKPKTEQPPPR